MWGGNPLSFNDPMGLQSDGMGLPNLEGEFRQFQQTLIDAYLNIATLAVGGGAPAAGVRVAEAACTPAGRGVAVSVLQLLGQAQKSAGMSLPPGMNGSLPGSASKIIEAMRKSTSAATSTARPIIVRPTLPSSGG